MKTKRLLSALVTSIALGVAAPAALAQQQSNPGVFDNVVVFGDSLSDAGYYRPFLLSLGLPPALVATMGRFTTNPGPVWSELVASYYGTTPAPSNANGTIYAQGGARVAINPGFSTPPGFAERSVATQIGEYLAKTGGAADPNTLYTLWAGANDVFFQLGALQAGAINQAQLQTNVLQAATDEITQVGRLRAAGARYIVVFALPDIGATPAFAGQTTAGAVSALSAGYNTTLFSGLAGAGLRVIPVDTFSLFAEIRANPGAYGFTNTTSPACGLFPPIVTQPQNITSLFCNTSSLVAPNAAQTFTFADFVHPTTASHAIVAQFVEQLIDAPIQYSLLAESALGARTGVMHTFTDTLLAAPRAGDTGVHVFATADGGGFDIDRGGGTSGLRSNTNTYSVGATVRAAEAVVLGAAYSEGKLRGSFGSGAGGFNTRDKAVSLFGSLAWGGFYGTGDVSIGNLEFQDVNRMIRLGAAVRTATATPNGSNASSFWTAGYDFRLGPVHIGPTLTLSTANVTVNSFDEQGAASANLHIAEQNLRSEVWGFGGRVSANFYGWGPWLRVTADHERRDDGRMVTASPLSLATGNSYDLPAFSSDRDFVTWSAGVSGWIGSRVLLGVSGFTTSGRSGYKNDGIGASISVKL